MRSDFSSKTANMLVPSGNPFKAVVNTVGGLLASRRVFYWLSLLFFCSYSTNNSMFARLGTDYEIRNQWFFPILEAMTTD